MYLRASTKHSSRMRTARLLTVGCVCFHGVCVFRGVSRGGAHPLNQQAPQDPQADTPYPCGQPDTRENITLPQTLKSGNNYIQTTDLVSHLSWTCISMVKHLVR